MCCASPPPPKIASPPDFIFARTAETKNPAFPAGFFFALKLSALSITLVVLKSDRASLPTRTFQVLMTRLISGAVIARSEATRQSRSRKLGLDCFQKLGACAELHFD
jgi:hypothetical protein